MSQTIRLAGREIAYQLVRSARRRTIALYVDHSGLTVRTPLRASGRQIERVLHDKAGWIIDRLAEWADRPAPAERVFECGTPFPFLGRDYTLAIHPHPTRARTRVEINDDRLVVEIDRHLVGDMRQTTIRKGLERWYRREAETRFPERVRFYAEQLGRPVCQIAIRSQKRRWGSCDSRGIIRLNWRLIGASPDLIDYVCAHEAAHLVEPNHSRAYWTVVESLMPDWKARRQRLNATAGHFVPF